MRGDAAPFLTRRQALVRGLGAAGGVIAAFVWAGCTSSSGQIRAGQLDDILSSIQINRQPFYNADGRFYLNPFPREALAKARTVPAYASVLAGYEAGLVALYQRCTHLGCRVPWCMTSQWFECPCHGSRYNRVGEKKGGPAPRGLDRFPVRVRDGVVTVDTSSIIPGPPPGIDTTGQVAEGPHCVGEALPASAPTTA